METFLAIGKVVLDILAISIVVLVLITERHNYQFVWSVWRQFRIKMFFECLGIIVLTIAMAISLRRIPGLDFGWLCFLYDGESGNILIKPIVEEIRSTNIFVRLMVTAFLIGLTFILPFLAQAEEIEFRKGHDKWVSVVGQSVIFGLSHCLVGVSIATGIALIIPGLFFGLKYKREFDRMRPTTRHAWKVEEKAVMVSTTYHTMYNSILVAVLLFASITAI